MPFIDDDEMVEALLTDGPNPTFRISIRIRSANRCVNHFDVLGLKDAIKRHSELCVPIMEYVAKSRCLVFNHPAQLARLMCDSVGGRMLGTACNVDTARA